MKYLLDTNICIAAMRNVPVVVQRMSSVSPGDCAVSTITSYEIHTGIQKCANPAKELSKVGLLLATVTQLSFDSNAAIQAANVRALLESQGQPIGPYDYLLAGHAMSTGLILVTANVGEFGRVPGLVVENWITPQTNVP